MAQIDLSGMTYILPILSFLFVFVVIFALLNKAKILEDKFWQAFLSLIIASIFISGVGVRTFVANVIPWFTVLMVCLFLIMVMIGFVGKDISFMSKGLGIAFVVILIIGFIVSAIFVFSSSINPYIPGDTGDAGPTKFTNWFFSSKIFGALLLVAISWIVAWILIKSK